MNFLPKLKPKRFSYKYRGEVCLNCVHPLDVSEQFCSNCGQRNSDKKISLGDLISELFSTFFSYDSKLWRSLKLLFLKPGILPLAYVNGKRNQYTNPFRFFLSIAIIFFLVASQFINEEALNKAVEEASVLINSQVDNVNTPANETQDSLVIEEVKSVLGLNSKNKEASDSVISLLDSIQNNNPNTKSSIIVNETGEDKSLSLLKAFKENSYFKYEEAIAQGLLEDSYSDWALYSFHRNWAKTQKGTGGFINFVVPKIPFFMFFFVPLFSIGFLLLFLGSGKRYVEHMVFNFNLSSFLLIVFAVFLIITAYWENTWLWFVLNLGIFYYTYRGIRNFYKQGRIASFLKCLIISFSFPIALSFFLLCLTVLSFIFY